MKQFGLLESFRNLNELNVNEYRRRASRRSLLLGDFAIQDSNNVNIVHESSIAVNSFILKSNLEQTEVFLSSSNIQGDVVFKAIDIPQWVYSNYQSNIDISGFSNDSKIQKKNDLSRFAFDESFLHLSNRPRFEDIAASFGYSEPFLKITSNLTELNKSISRTNLGLTQLATYDSIAAVTNITVESNLNVSYETFRSNNYLHIDSKNVNTKIYTFPLLQSTLINDSSNIPSIVLLSNIYYQLSNTLGTTAYSNKDYISSNKDIIKSYLSNDILFNVEQNFRDLDTVKKQTVVNNLNISNIAYQDSNNLSVNILTVNNDIINSESNVVFFDNNFLKINDFLSVQNPGFVRLSNITTYDDMSNSSNAVYSQLNTINGSIKNAFDDFSNDLFKSNENLSNIDNSMYARANLGVNTFAMDGRLQTLSDRPLYLTEFINDKQYVSKYDSLRNMNRQSMLQNLGISNMAFEDAQNIGGQPNALYALGLGNLKFHSTDTVIDIAFVDEGEFYLKAPDKVEFQDDKDFIVLQKDDTGAQYTYKAIEKLNEEWYTTFYPNFRFQNEYLRVKLNDNSNIVYPAPDALGNAQPEQPQLKTLIRGDHFVPTAQFMYDKFVEITSNILSNMSIPFEYYPGGYTNVLSIDEVPNYTIM